MQRYLYYSQALPQSSKTAMITFILTMSVLLILAIMVIYLALFDAKERKLFCLGSLLSIGLSIGICLVAVTLYLYWGASHAWLLARQQEKLITTWNAQMQHPERVIQRFKDYLSHHPQDAKAWFLLGKIEMGLRDYQAATLAFDKANALQPQDLETGWYRIQAEFMSQKGLSVTNRQRLSELLQREPNFLPAINLLALADYQQGNYRHAIQQWQRLLIAMPEGSEEQRWIATEIKQAEQHLSVNQPVVTVRIMLDPKLSNKLNATDVLWVFARAEPSQPGLPPVAVQRLAISTFPRQIQLDTSMAMLANFSLANVEKITIVARISHHWHADRQTNRQVGDLEGRSDTVLLKHQTHPLVRLTIDHIVSR